MQSVVDLCEFESGIIQVTMQDRVNKNTFTNQFIADITSAFEKINSSSKYKVAILTGYDSYFASGGTQEALLAIYKGEAKFTDANIYQLPMECDIPVIAAMQGHGIGGGLVMGLFADFIILSRESIYTANFMKYGFTPGMGATCIMPQKLGIALAEEMLLSAGNYRGAELEKRGIPFQVLPRQEVMGHAYQLARQLTEKPRTSLVTLKRHLVSDLREKLSKAIEQEIIMHDITFHQPEVKNKIIDLFGK